MEYDFPIVDCHAHPADARLVSCAGEIMAESVRAGVARMLLNGTRPEDWNRTLNLASAFGYDGAIGVHPFYAADWNKAAEQKMRSMLASGNIAAIGEIGLDGTLDKATFTAQKCAFEEQLAIACEFELPVALHVRNAWDAFFDVTSRIGISRLQGYCHNFTGPWEIGARLVEAGLLLSFNTPVFRGRKLLSTVENISLDSILTESDMPDMPMPGHDDKRPWHAGSILRRLAVLKGILTEDLVSAVLKNYDRLFRRWRDN